MYAVGVTLFFDLRIWFHEDSGMKIKLHSTTPVKRIADSPRPHPRWYLHMLNAFVGFCIASVHIRAKTNGAVVKNFFAFEPRKKWGEGKKVKEAALLLPHFLALFQCKKSSFMWPNFVQLVGNTCYISQIWTGWLNPPWHSTNPRFSPYSALPFLCLGG